MSFQSRGGRVVHVLLRTSPGGATCAGMTCEQKDAFQGLGLFLEYGTKLILLCLFGLFAAAVFVAAVIGFVRGMFGI